jgi:hypothetical protein
MEWQAEWVPDRLWPETTAFRPPETLGLVLGEVGFGA